MNANPETGHVYVLRDPKTGDCTVVGTYEPLPYGFGGFKPGMKPSDYAMK